MEGESDWSSICCVDGDVLARWVVRRVGGNGSHDDQKLKCLVAEGVICKEELEIEDLQNSSRSRQYRIDRKARKKQGSKKKTSTKVLVGDWCYSRII